MGTFQWVLIDPSSTKVITSQNLLHYRLGQLDFELFKTAIIRYIFFSIWLLDFMFVSSFILFCAAVVSSFSLLVIIHLYEYTTIYLSINKLDLWVVSTLELL